MGHNMKLGSHTQSVFVETLIDYLYVDDFIGSLYDEDETYYECKGDSVCLYCCKWMTNSADTVER